MIEDTLAKSLEETANEFSENELAFLALTTKIELPLRDRWAYVLYRELAKSNLIVSREWKRVDLAIVKDKEPVALIELKAMYTFDAVYEKGNYKKRIGYLNEDGESAKKLATKNTSIYTVLLATHPMSEIPDSLEGVVKYHPGINGALRNFGGQEAVATEAKSRVEEEFGDQAILKSGVLHGGSAFGIDINVMYWIIKVQ